MWRNSTNPTTEHLVLYRIHKQEEDNFMRERSIQIRKAMTWLRQCDDAASPHFNIKTGRWSLGKGKKQTESYYLEKIIQDYIGMKLKFRYHWHGEIITRYIFAEVLEDIIYRYDDFNIDGFEEDYNMQQRKCLMLIQNKIKLLKSGKVISHA
jgi:hypothetical protein